MGGLSGSVQRAIRSVVENRRVGQTGAQPAVEKKKRGSDRRPRLWDIEAGGPIERQGTMGLSTSLRFRASGRGAKGGRSYYR